MGATFSQIVAWIGSSFSLVKFDLRSHPSEVVLLVIESVQSPSLSHPAMMMIH
jgi:hypothetical protein